MKKLQTESASPLYRQLMQRIRVDIEKGKYPAESRPSMSWNSCIRSAG